jgi:hypothetical protein
MSDYRFSLIVPGAKLTPDQILDVTDAFGNAGFTDVSIRGHVDGFELLFDRAGESLQAAITSAISEVERVGYRVGKVEMEREAIPV